MGVIWTFWGNPWVLCGALVGLVGVVWALWGGLVGLVGVVWALRGGPVGLVGSPMGPVGCHVV